MTYETRHKDTLKKQMICDAAAFSTNDYFPQIVGVKIIVKSSVVLTRKICFPLKNQTCHCASNRALDNAPREDYLVMQANTFSSTVETEARGAGRRERVSRNSRTAQRPETPPIGREVKRGYGGKAEEKALAYAA